MSYEALFSRYGYPTGDGRVEIRGYLGRPEKQDKLESVIYQDQTAARLIRECLETVELLKEYRQALAVRYGQLETMPYTEGLSLTRQKAYRGPVTFTVRLERRYSDGTTVNVFTEVFSGKERKQAIEKFNSMKSERPGIATAVDLDKGAWEK